MADIKQLLIETEKPLFQAAQEDFRTRYDKSEVFRDEVDAVVGTKEVVTGKPISDNDLPFLRESKARRKPLLCAAELVMMSAKVKKSVPDVIKDIRKQVSEAGLEVEK